VADRYRVVADQYFFHKQSHNTLPLSNVDGLSTCTKPRKEARQCRCKLQVSGTVGELILKRFQLALIELFAIAQLRHALS